MHDIWFVYDGECPICTMGASLYKLRQSVGTLYTVDARTQIQHPIMQEIKTAGIDLDQGMVVKYNEALYHGADALKLLARLGADTRYIDRLANQLFQSERIVRLSYPLMKLGRRIALIVKCKPLIRNLENN